MARPSSNRRSRRRRTRAAAQAAASPAQGAADEPVEASSTTVPRPQTMLRPRRSTPSTTIVSAPRTRLGFLRRLRPQLLADIINELRQVVWPTRAETQNLTMVVLVVAIVVGVLLGVVDWGFNKILENVLLP